MSHKNKRGGIIELITRRPRNEEEKFYVHFSSTQLNSILLIILAATFLVQGIIRYLEIIERVDLIRPWFFLILSAFLFLASSVFLIALGGVIAPLRLKRSINTISFAAFMLGFLIFLISLFFLAFTI